jgi:hypothetical protein
MKSPPHAYRYFFQDKKMAPIIKGDSTTPNLVWDHRLIPTGSVRYREGMISGDEYDKGVHTCPDLRNRLE